MWSFLAEEKVVLASASPRRKRLLENAGLEFSQCPVEIDESFTDGQNPERLVVDLSIRKAFKAAEGKKSGWIIAADTVVVKEERILGKPSSEVDAFNILQDLRECSHTVITGYTILYVPTGKAVSDRESTQVTFTGYTDDDIARYISTGEPMDKAGAYGIQGMGGLFVESICGCYFNVVGLPVPKLRRTWLINYRKLIDASSR